MSIVRKESIFKAGMTKVWGRVAKGGEGQRRQVAIGGGGGSRQQVEKGRGGGG